MNREQQIIKAMMDAIGLGNIGQPKGKDFSPYYDSKGKRYTNKEATQHEIVFDKQGNSMPNPVARNVESYPLMPTPVGNAIETVANASAEINPLLGLIASAIPYGNKKPPRNSKMNNPYMDEYRNSLGGYGPKANDYVDGAIDAYGNGKNRKVYDLPSHTNSEGMNGVMVQGNNVGIKLSPEEVKKIQAGVKNDRITTLQDETRRADRLGQGVYPTVDNNNNVQGVYPITLQKRVDDMYGDRAVDFLNEGKSEMGYMRGLENRAPQSGKVFGKTLPQLEMDISGVEHAEQFSTIKDWGEGLEYAKRISRENNNMPIARFITPGGVSHIPLGAEWHKNLLGGSGYRDFFSLAKKYNVDPAFMNMELNKLSEDAWEIYAGGMKSNDPKRQGIAPLLSIAQKRMGGYPLSDFMNSEWIKRVQRGDKYPIINRQDKPVGWMNTQPGEPFMKKDGTFWKSEEWMNPAYSSQWDRIKENQFTAFDNVHFMDFPNMPSEIYDNLNQGHGYLGNMRLSAKGSRIDNLTQGKVGKPILDENGNPTGKLYDAPFTRQFVDIVGNKDQLSPFAMERVFGSRGLIDGVDQLRSAQGLTDPHNPILSRGFGDSNYIEHIMKNMTNKDKELARNAWKLGVVPPMLLQDDEE